MHTDQELWRYLDGELEADQAAAIEQSAREDEALGRRLDEMRMLKTEVVAGAPQPPGDFPARVALLAARGTQAPILDIADARLFLRKTLAAAALLGAIGLAYLAFGWLPEFLEPSPMQANPLLGGK